MSEVIRLELPYPDRRLSPNARVHWREKATVVAQYRVDCGWAARAGVPLRVDESGRTYRAQPHVTPPVEATVTFVVPDRRRRDEQNFLQMLKPAFDGLVDAGVLTDDNHEVFKVVSTSFEVGMPKVIVELRGGEQANG